MIKFNIFINFDVLLVNIDVVLMNFDVVYMIFSGIDGYSCNWKKTTEKGKMVIFVIQHKNSKVPTKQHLKIKILKI
mgnify:CR=1 FL=1